MNNSKTGGKQQKEDLLAPTELNQPSKAPEKGNLSDAELRERLDLYSSVGENLDDRWTIQGMKERYLNDIKEREAKISKAVTHYAQGVSAGLPHAPYNAIQYSYDNEKQALRDVVWEEAKDYYRDKNSLSKEFGESKDLKANTIKPSFDKAKSDYEARDR
ncbi:hypothetical protein [Marinoscillum sp.]|uniref:hypothetical protein n=1 Tax=Marinoscillum sp. TaxID=2024838 RepID=UPI003BAAE88C